MKLSQIENIRQKFHWKDGKPDLDCYGIYRMGLTGNEIYYYLQARANKVKIKKLVDKFYDIAGCNTMSMSPTGEGLMYRHDVERFAEKLFNNTETYFD